LQSRSLQSYPYRTTRIPKVLYQTEMFSPRGEAYLATSTEPSIHPLQPFSELWVLFLHFKLCPRGLSV